MPLGEGLSVLVADTFSVSQENLMRLRQAVPCSVDLVADHQQLCDGARNAGRAVGIVDAKSPELLTVVHQFAEAGAGGLLAVAAEPTDDLVIGLVNQGVMGVVLATSPAEELITAIRAIASGYLFVSPRFLPVLADTMLRNPRAERARELREILTGRELDVLLLIAAGNANQDIAAQLGISVATVRSHVLSILRKMNVPNRTMAAICAYRSGLTGS